MMDILAHFLVHCIFDLANYAVLEDSEIKKKFVYGLSSQTNFSDFSFAMILILPFY
jgi:hypothetical protein